MIIRILSTTLLQIFRKFMLYSKFISKSLTSPDDTRQVCIGFLRKALGISWVSILQLVGARFHFQSVILEFTSIFSVLIIPPAKMT